MAPQIALAATGTQSLQAGLAVAAEGGTAVDAAIAAMMVTLATEPGIVSFGGGGYACVWPAGDDPVVIDGNVTMPGIGSPPHRFGAGVREVVTSYGGGLTMHAGWGSVGTPGAVAALAETHDRYAALPWRRLVAPAASVAREGYPMSYAAARYLTITADALFGEDPEAFGLITRPAGGVIPGGEVTRNPALADTLDRLGVDGPDLFTTGAVGQALVTAMADNGGLVTHDDLVSYRPVVRPAHQLRLGDWQIATNPPPAIGGVMLAVMLGELATRPEYTEGDVIEIQRAVLGYRLRVHDYSADLEGDGVDLLSRFDTHGLTALRGSPATAHISAVDSLGNACAITMSSGYGAGMCIPGTGILLNNTLGEMELNRLGLHALPPGTRLASNMAPTTGRTADGRVLSVGSPGADRITTSLMQVLGAGCLRGLDLQPAIDAPRLHVRLSDDETEPVVEYERDPQISRSVLRLGLRGHEYPDIHMYFGGVGAAYLGPDGVLEAAGDSRREAAPGVSVSSPGGS